MKTLYLERSTGSARDGGWTDGLDLDGVERIVVGMGPGSFAGVRSALAFAQGFALGRSCEVLGLPSPCAVAAQMRDVQHLAVVGDARRGMAWIALFDGLKPLGDVFLADFFLVIAREVFQVPADSLAGAVPEGYSIATVDESRIGESLARTFGGRYLGGCLPTSEGLRAFAEANPDALVREPLPIYLNPAVRT